MFNNVNYNPSFTGNYKYTAKDIENLAKYAAGVAITNKDDVSVGDLAISTLPDLTVKGMSWLKNNKGNYSNAIKTAKQNSQALHDVYKSGGTVLNGIKAVSNSSSANEILKMLPDAKSLESLSTETQSLYNEVKAAAELAKNGSKDALTNASTLLTKANAAAYAETTSQATGIFSKIKNALGINKLGNFVNNLAIKHPTLGKVLNVCKSNGAGIMLALEGATEVISNVVPTFKELGVKSGAKQVGKSAVKTVSSVGGWVAGAALGTKVGAVLGSVIPGAGTAVGAAVGAVIGSVSSLIGGMLGSKLLKGVAEKVVGKDELELAKEKEAQELALQAQNDPNVLNNVVNVAFEKLNNEGISDEDSQIAYDSLKTIATNMSLNTSNQVTETLNNKNIQGSTSMSNPFVATNTSFTGLNMYQTPTQTLENDLLMQQISSQYGLT